MDAYHSYHAGLILGAGKPKKAHKARKSHAKKTGMAPLFGEAPLYGEGLRKKRIGLARKLTGMAELFGEAPLYGEGKRKARRGRPHKTRMAPLFGGLILGAGEGEAALYGEGHKRNYHLSKTGKTAHVVRHKGQPRGDRGHALAAYRHVLDEVRASHPHMSYREAQKVASHMYHKK